jgi:hypothetical protein
MQQTQVRPAALLLTYQAGYRRLPAAAVSQQNGLSPWVDWAGAVL